MVMSSPEDTNPGLNGALPLTLETLDRRVQRLEHGYEEDRLILSLVPDIAKGQQRVGRVLDKIARSMNINPDSDGPPPDFTGKLRALEDADAKLLVEAARLRAEDDRLRKQVHRATFWNRKVAGYLALAVPAIGGVTVAVYKLIEVLVAAFGGGGSP